MRYADSLNNFILGAMPNTWMYFPHLSVYVRKGFHTLPPFRAVQNTFDIANVQVEEAHQKKLIFTEFLTVAEDVAKTHHLVPYVESVLNPHLAGWLARRGYSRMGPLECPNFFLFT